MENNLMEKLLNDFEGTLEEFEKLVARKDYDQVVKVVAELERLLAEEQGIRLDERGPEYDHVLHEMLSKMSGVIDTSKKIMEDESLQPLQDEKEVLEDEKRILEKEVETLENKEPEMVLVDEEIEGITVNTVLERINLLREDSTDRVKDLAALELEALIAQADDQGRIPYSKVTELAKKLEDEKSGVALSDEEKAELDAKNELLRKELEEAQNELKGLEDRVDFYTEGATEELRNQMKALLDQRDDYSTRIKDLRKSITKLKKDLKKVENTPPSEKKEVLEPDDYQVSVRFNGTEGTIRNLLKNKLNLSDEEIEKTIDQYSLEPYGNGAEDSQGNETLEQLSVLVRKEPTEKEVIEARILKIESEIAALRSEKDEKCTKPIRRLTTQLRNAKRDEINRLVDEKKSQLESLREEMGISEDRTIEQIREELNAERAEYEKGHDEASDTPDKDNRISDVNRRLENLILIERLEKEVAELETLQTVFKRAGKKKDLTDKIKSLKDQIRSNESAKEAMTGKADEERADVIDMALSEISTFEDKKITYTTQVEQAKEMSDEDKKAIEEKRARISEIDKRIAEIDKELKDAPFTIQEGKKLDVAQEAQRVGDHIFKTAKIRRELASRNVSREEFLDFYMSGYELTKRQIDQVQKETDEVAKEIEILVYDPEENLYKGIVGARDKNDLPKQVEIYEKMRQNMIKAGRENELVKLGIDHEVTESDVHTMELWFGSKITDLEEKKDDLGRRTEELKENLSIFSNEITRIKMEQAYIKVAEGQTPEEMIEKAEQRKTLRAKLLEASITPKKELTDEQKELLKKWQEASKEFVTSDVLTEFSYIDRDGNTQVLEEVYSIDDTQPGYAEKIDFLGIPDLKQNIEQIDAYEQTQDPYIFGENVGRAFDAAERERTGAGQEIIDRVLADKKEYVDTFNGIPNPHRVKYETLKTAGSTLKGMKPVDRNLPMPTRAKNLAENTARFLGFRAPKFTRFNSEGKQVSDIRGGAMTLATDALVAGAVIGSAVTLGPAIPIIGYAAKGIVTIGNRIAARIEYSRHKEEIEGNLPVLNQATGAAREVARKEYYREHGDNRLVAWGKAKFERYIAKGKAKETEQAIVSELTDAYCENEDIRTQALIDNLEKAKSNQEARQTRQKQVAMSDRTYNDIVRDPDSIDQDEATKIIAINAATEAARQGSTEFAVNRRSNKSASQQYVKDPEELAKTEDLDRKGIKKNNGPVSSVTIEQIYTGEKQKVDFRNKVLTIITAGGLKLGYSALKDQFMSTTEIQHDAETTTHTVHHDAEYETKTVPVMEERPDTDIGVNDMFEAAKGKTVKLYRSVSGGNKGEMDYTITGSEKCSGIHFSDGTKWGHGLSDDAPLMTDEYWPEALRDASGHLKSDITINDIVSATANGDVSIEDLANFNVQVDGIGWTNVKELIGEATKQVQVGEKTVDVLVKAAYDETVTDIVKDAYTETIKNFDPSLVTGAAKDGALIGVAVDALEQAHEGAHNTYVNGITPGMPSKKNPFASASMSRIAKRINDRAIKEHEKQAEESDRDER